MYRQEDVTDVISMCYQIRWDWLGTQQNQRLGWIPSQPALFDSRVISHQKETSCIYATWDWEYMPHMKLSDIQSNISCPDISVHTTSRGIVVTTVAQIWDPGAMQSKQTVVEIWNIEHISRKHKNGSAESKKTQWSERWWGKTRRSCSHVQCVRTSHNTPLNCSNSSGRMRLGSRLHTHLLHAA